MTPIAAQLPTCADCGRSFAGTLAARYCPEDRWRHRGKHKKYVWTEQKDEFLRERYDPDVRNRSREVAAQLGWPCWVIKKRAVQLKLTKPQRYTPWTTEELRYLEDVAGQRHVGWIARKMRRSLTSVIMKIKYLGIRQAVTNGYTMRGLAECFGVDANTVGRWATEGKIRVKRRNSEAEQHSPWMVSDREVLRFVREHRNTYRLDRVDQDWFLDLVLGGGPR